MSALLESYRGRLVLAGVRPTTLRAKMYVLTAFAASIAPRELVDATRADCETFLTNRPLKPESRRAYRSALRGLYMWAADEELIPVDPTARIPTVRVPRGTPRPISAADLDRALSLGDARMRAWLLLMALAGLRCIEVAALRPMDLQQSEGGVLLYLRECKGGGTATVPAHPAILEALASVPIRDGLWWTCNPTTVSAQTSTFLRSIGIDATAHRLRHFAGSAWYRASGHDLLTTSTLLRHANVNTSMIYAQTDPTRPAEVVNAVPLRLVDPGAAVG